MNTWYHAKGMHDTLFASAGGFHPDENECKDMGQIYARIHLTRMIYTDLSK